MQDIPLVLSWTSDQQFLHQHCILWPPHCVPLPPTQHGRYCTLPYRVYRNALWLGAFAKTLARTHQNNSSSTSTKWSTLYDTSWTTSLTSFSLTVNPKEINVKKWWKWSHTIHVLYFSSLISTVLLCNYWLMVMLSL